MSPSTPRPDANPQEPNDDPTPGDAVIGRDAITAADNRVRPHVRRTPILTLSSSELGLKPDYELVLKLELVQHTGSFKPRGAFNRVLSAVVPDAGLIAASGGNHGLAVAHVGARLGHRAEIFVPETAPAIKVDRLRRLGARVSQVGQVYDEARIACEARASETGALMVHAFDQPEVVAGAGTLARELMQQADSLDTILVAVGGGGLIGGTAAWVQDDVAVVAVEPERCAAMNSALAAGRPIAVEVGGLAVDALAARQVGHIAYACARKWVDGSILVRDEEIAAAQQRLWQELRLIAEPAGATALAGLLSGAHRPAAGSRVAVLVCGANTAPGEIAAT